MAISSKPTFSGGPHVHLSPTYLGRGCSPFAPPQRICPRTSLAKTTPPHATSGTLLPLPSSPHPRTSERTNRNGCEQSSPRAFVITTNPILHRSSTASHGQGTGTAFTPTRGLKGCLRSVSGSILESPRMVQWTPTPSSTRQANLRPLPGLPGEEETRANVSLEAHSRSPHPRGGRREIMQVRVHKPLDHSRALGLARPPPWSQDVQWGQKGPGKRRRRKKRRAGCGVLPFAKAPPGHITHQL